MDFSLLVTQLQARRSGNNWVARCPAHEDRHPSLSIGVTADGKVLVRCHAGCDQHSVIDALRARGLWDSDHHNNARALRPIRIPEIVRPSASDVARTDFAMKIWRSATAAKGTLAEVYLNSRGLALPAAASLRFLRRQKHPSGDMWPVMVALVVRGNDGQPLGIHRTYLARDGRTKAPVETPKLMLGPCRGGAVRLSQGAGPLMIGEGIETSLSAAQGSTNQVWAALSTSGLRALDLPPSTREVIILADGDCAGEDAALSAAHRWVAQGRRVKIARPPRDTDFNDLLMDSIAGTTES